MDSVSLQQEAVRIIGKYFGDHTSDLYSNFYKNKPDDVIIASLEQLLIDFIGKDKTDLEIKHLKLAINPTKV